MQHPAPLAARDVTVLRRAAPAGLDRSRLTDLLATLADACANRAAHHAAAADSLWHLVPKEASMNSMNVRWVGLIALPAFP